jgi:hypothetical protein
MNRVSIMIHGRADNMRVVCVNCFNWQHLRWNFVYVESRGSTGIKRIISGCIIILNFFNLFLLILN